MTKKIIILVLLLPFFSTSVNGQSIQLSENQLDSIVNEITAVLPVKNIISCKTNIANAYQDIQKNSIRYQFQGITGPDQPAYLWVMRNEYHINVKPTNAILEEGMCYNFLINNELAKKYGENIWDEINQKAEHINNSGIGGSALTKFISKNLNMLGVQPSDAEKPMVEVLCETNAEGKLVQCQVMQSYSEKFDNEAIRVMKLIPKWRAIPQKMTITVVFDPSAKNEENE